MKSAYRKPPSPSLCRNGLYYAACSCVSRSTSSYTPSCPPPALLGAYGTPNLHRLKDLAVSCHCKTAGARSRSLVFLVSCGLLAVTLEVLFARVRTSRQCRIPKDLRIVFEFAVAIWVLLNLGENIGIVLQRNWALPHTRIVVPNCIAEHSRSTTPHVRSPAVRVMADIAWMFHVM